MCVKRGTFDYQLKQIIMKTLNGNLVLTEKLDNGILRIVSQGTFNAGGNYEIKSLFYENHEVRKEHMPLSSNEIIVGNVEYNYNGSTYVNITKNVWN